jgi:hypothetical protein
MNDEFINQVFIGVGIVTVFAAGMVLGLYLLFV